MRFLTMIGCLAFSFALLGCEKKSETSSKTPAKPATAKPATATPAKDDHAHKPGDDHAHESHDGHAHAKADSHGGHSGEVIELGTLKVDQFEVRASRDKGALEPGGDAPVDVWIDGGLGEGVKAVRFWIGTEDGAGSLKAKADIENGKWHTHVEIPSPAPTGCRLWVEIDGPENKKLLGSFDLHK